MSLSMNISGDTRVVQKMDGLKKLLENPKDALEEVGEVILEETEKNFKSEGSRFGSRWKSLKSASQRQKVKMGYGAKQILERTGKLKAGFKKEVSRFKVTVTNTVSYFKYHQLGSKPQPKREMLKATENLKQNVIEVINKHIQKLIK